MKVIPKFQSGGNFDALFTAYDPTVLETPKQASTSSGSKKTSEPLEKGKLTEKDFFTMIKDLDGLPNEMRSLVKSLMSVFELSQISGTDPSDLASTYLLTLYKMRLYNDNKKKYDTAFKEAEANGALNEPAISTDGKLFVLDKKSGQTTTVDLNTYFKNKDNYHLLTTSQLANIRAYDPGMINNQFMFNVMKNGMGYLGFLKLLKDLEVSLGKDTVTRDGLFSIESKAAKGLEVLRSLSREDLAQLSGSITAEGLYKYHLVDENLFRQIKSLVSYAETVLPENAKVWAAMKLDTPKQKEALEVMLLSYFTAKSSTDHKLTITHPNDKTNGTGSAEPTDKTKEGRYRLMQTEKGGSPIDFWLKNLKGNLIIEGRYYGDTDKPTMSLSEYLEDTGSLRNAPENITFGDSVLSQDSYSDVVVNSAAGSVVVTLPMRDGKIDFDILPTYTEIMDKVKNSNLEGKEREEYQKKLMHDAYLDELIDESTGLLNPKRFGLFLVLEGYTSSRALVKGENSRYTSIDESSDSPWIVKSSKKEAYKFIELALSKGKQKYHLDYNEFYDISSYFGRYDKVYKGQIYIPLSNNPLDAMYADDNKVTSAEAKLMDKAAIADNKLHSAGSTKSFE